MSEYAVFFVFFCVKNENYEKNDNIGNNEIAKSITDLLITARPYNRKTAKRPTAVLTRQA